MADKTLSVVNGRDSWLAVCHLLDDNFIVFLIVRFKQMVFTRNALNVIAGVAGISTIFSRMTRIVQIDSRFVVRFIGDQCLEDLRRLLAKHNH